MQTLQISYVTWTRSDANGLFDYEELKQRKADDSLTIEKSGFICRRKEDYKIHFSSVKLDPSKYQEILRVIKRDNHFILKCLEIKNQPLFKIIEKQYPKMHQLQKEDILKLGKVTIQVLELEFKLKQRISSYALIKKQMQFKELSAVRQITPEFYGQGEMSKTMNMLQTSLQSCYEQNPACRYCYSKTVTEDNPFIVSCGCIGSAKYIHEKCLLQWFLRRGNIQQRQNTGVLFADQKIFKCQLCHKLFYVPELWRKFYNYQKNHQNNLEGKPFEQVLILYVKYQTNWLYFIDLSKKRQVLIGRSLQNQMVINDLSVSRLHAKLEIDSAEKIVTLSNNNAKFGTLVQIKSVQVQDDENYQVGRTKMSFKKYQKKSWLDRIGLFCFLSEKLNNQKLKTHRSMHQKHQRMEKEKNQPDQEIFTKPNNFLEHSQ